MSQLFTPEGHPISRQLSRRSFGFPTQGSPGLTAETSNQWYTPLPSSFSTGMSAIVYTPDATTRTFSESGQPGSMLDGIYQGHHATTGSMSSLHLDANGQSPAFYNDLTSQSPLPNSQSDISAHGSSGNYDGISDDHANRPMQESGMGGDGKEDGFEDGPDCRGFGESQNLYSYGTVAQFPQSSNGYSASITEVQDILNRVMAPVDVPLGNFNTSSSSGPWNPYKVSIDQNTSADQVMFAPDIHYNLESSLAPGAYLDTGHLPDEVNSNTRFRPQINLQSQQVSLEKSMDNLPSTNPVGPSNLLVGNTTHKIKKVPKTEGKGRRHKCLSPHRRAEVRIMRKRGACWHCKCMREKCDGGTKCRKCTVMRPQSFPWGCVRCRLVELTPIFLPGSLLNQHQEVKIREFARKHVRKWTNNSMKIRVTWGHSKDISCDVQEIVPEGNLLCLQYQYKLNLATNLYDRVQTPSPPLGMMLMSVNDWRKKLHDYLDYVLEHDFHDFPDHCFRGSENEVQRDLLRHFHKYYESTAEPKERVLPNVLLKLVIISKIMMHTLTLVESEKEEIVRNLQYHSPKPYGIHTSSRWLNKQLKFLFSNLHEELLKNALQKIHSILESSTRAKTWGSALTGLLILAMTVEAIQMTIRCKAATDKSENLIPGDSDEATTEIKQIEEKWEFLQGLFHTSYRRNPIHSDRDRHSLADAPSQQLARDVKSVIEKHRCFLETRQYLDPPPNSSNPHSSRLVARFLLYPENTTASA